MAKNQKAASTKVSNKQTKPKITKSAQVKHHLIKKKSITSWEAITLYKATRLSSIIFNMRKSGYKISSTPLTTKDANGTTVTYAKYVLVSEPKKH